MTESRPAATIWPVAPMLKRPVLYANVTERPVNTSGMALEKVLKMRSLEESPPLKSAMKHCIGFCPEAIRRILPTRKPKRMATMETSSGRRERRHSGLSQVALQCQ